MSDSLGFVTVARTGEIPTGGVKIVRLEDTTVAVFHLDDGYWAMEDVCTHDGGPVAEGTLEGSTIECPRHGATFDVRTGAAKDAAPVNPHTGQRQPWEEPATPAAAAAPASAASTELPPPEKPSGPPAFSSMPSQQELAVRAALETVMDPEINLSVIDLGLIREIHFLPQRTHVRMMLTTPFCPYAPQLMADVKAASESVVPQPCEVEIMPDAWSPEMMPDPSLLGFSY